MPIRKDILPVGLKGANVWVNALGHGDRLPGDLQQSDPVPLGWIAHKRVT